MKVTSRTTQEEKDRQMEWKRKEDERVLKSLFPVQFFCSKCELRADVEGEEDIYKVRFGYGRILGEWRYYTSVICPDCGNEGHLFGKKADDIARLMIRLKRKQSIIPWYEHMFG